MSPGVCLYGVVGPVWHQGCGKLGPPGEELGGVDGGGGGGQDGGGPGGEDGGGDRRGRPGEEVAGRRAGVWEHRGGI